MLRRAVPFLAWLPYVVLSITHVITLATGSTAAQPTKLTLMPLLALPVLIAAPRLRPRAAVTLILGALLFSWLGDGAGTLFPSAPTLPLMLLFFGIAHIAYIVLFTRFAGIGPVPRWTIIYLAWWVGMLIALGPHVGALIFGVALYGLVLAGTAATSARCGPLTTVGGAFFLASDTVLAFRLFLPEAMPAWTSPAVMLAYTFGQGLIIAGLLRTLRRKEAR